MQDFHVSSNIQQRNTSSTTTKVYALLKYYSSYIDREIEDAINRANS